MSELITKGFRITEETRKMVEGIIEKSNLQQGEWLQAAAILYEMQELRDNKKEYEKEIKELEIHTKRIIELVLGVITQADVEKEDLKRAALEKDYSKDKIIQELQEKLVLKEQEMIQIKESYDEVMNELEKLQEELTEIKRSNSNNQALINEYREKINRMSILQEKIKILEAEKKEWTTILEGNEQEHHKKIQEMNDKLIEATSAKQTAEDEYTLLVSSSQNEKTLLLQNIEELKRHHQENIERIKREKELEKKQEILDLRSEFQELLMKNQEKYNEKLESMYTEMNQLRQQLMDQKEK